MGWRSKLIFLLIVYFAGFATAIYYVVPACNADFREDFSSDGLAISYDSQIHKYRDIAAEATEKVKLFVKEKIQERQIAKDFRN